MTILFQHTRAAPAAPATGLSWSGVAAISNTVNTPHGALKPVVEIAPDGSGITIAYIRLKEATGVFSDPVFSTSTDGGETWSTPLFIHDAFPWVQAFFMDFAYDLSNVRHAVWTSGIDLFYKSETSWNNPAIPPFPLSEPGAAPGASDPVIVGGNGTLDVIWSEGQNSNPNILHRRYAGSAWATTNQTISATLSNSLVPSLAVDDTGSLHAVWEEGTSSSNSKIYYAQGVPGTGTDVSWSKAIPISREGATDWARYPKITTNGTTLLVSYTNWRDIGGSPPPAREEYQEIHHVRCSSSCTNAGNWALVLSSSQFVGTNKDDPYDSVIGDIVSVRSCAYIYYHGTSADFNFDKEVLWGNSSCSGSREKQTPDGDEIYQSGNPDLATYDNWIHMVYEQEISERQIYYVKAEAPLPGLYLPIIVR
jgi:hypothetical protein